MADKLKLISEELKTEYRLGQVGVHALHLTELLELLIGGKKGREIGERLMHTYGGLDGLARASIFELTSITGVGKTTAMRIKTGLELGRRLLATVPNDRPRITSPADTANLLMPDMMFLEQEHLKLVLLNTRNQVLKIPTIYIGSLNSSVVRIAELFRAAMKENAAAFIVAHNHPSGDPTPSPEDIHVTRQIVKAGRLLDIDVLDHIVIGRQRYVSLKERGLGFD